MEAFHQTLRQASAENSNPNDLAAQELVWAEHLFGTDMLETLRHQVSAVKG